MMTRSAPTLLVLLMMVAPCMADGRKTYLELLARFPAKSQGLGRDRGDPTGGPAHQPMTYGLIVSAEALRYRAAPTAEGKRRLRARVRWLLDNARLAKDGKPGWGLPQAWERRPENTSYTITTAIVLEGLLDVLDVPDFWKDDPATRNEILRTIKSVQVRWCRELWAEGFGGGYFHYSPHDGDPSWFCVNAPAMFLGVMARFVAVHEQAFGDSREELALIRQRRDQLASAIVATATLRKRAPYWDYIAVPNPVKSKRPNDLVHQVYILWGIETYRDMKGSVAIPWTRADSLESLDRFWKDGRLRFFAQDEETVKLGNREAPTNLWGAGMMLAFVAKWGSATQAERCLEAIARDHGPFPDLRVLPREASKDGAFYPRDAAHVLFGLAHAFYRK